MKAIRVHRWGGPEVLQLEEVPAPTPGPGQVVVRVEAAGINFIDVYQRTGHYKTPLPFTPGQEAAGTVTAVGPGVTAPRVGDRVAYTGVLGAYAEYAVVPADRVVALPDAVSAEQGAAAMLQGMTAHYLATSTYPLKPGDACLVHAAAGGVLAWVHDGKLKLRIAHTFPLAEAAEAHRQLEGRKTTGKVLLIPSR